MASEPETIRIHRFMPASRANGPGVRAVIWVQGCTLGCAGCFNPETHDPAGGERVAADDLFERTVALGDSIEGITLSGGEPLQQIGGVSHLLRRVRRETSLSTLLFTGYTLSELARFVGADELLDSLDVLIAGRYDAARRLGSGLRGSDNQVIWRLTERYAQTELATVPPAEVVILPEGEILASGVDPLRLERPDP